MTPAHSMPRHPAPAFAALLTAAAVAAGSAAAEERPAGPEPNAEIACHWWPDLKDVWTPVGWKNHLYRYNIFYNGIIDAHPDLNARTQAAKGLGVQLYPAFTTSGRWAPNTDRDDCAVVQGWEERAVPVLWSEWSVDGFLVRQSVFAHLPGGRAVETGTEPLFLWVRVSVHDTCAALPLEPKAGLAYKLNAPHISGSMTLAGNVWFNPAASAYPRKLAPDADGAVPAAGWRLVEEDGRLRLGVAPAGANRAPATVSYAAGKPQAGDAVLAVLLDGKKGATADLLVPIVPADRAVFDAELALGYDAALAEADAYWKATEPPTAAVADTPEPLINDVIRHSLKFAEVIAEKNPADGQYSLLSGSLSYSALWATPHSMNCVMLLDTMGHHAVVDRHLEIFRKEQGTVKPPGDDYAMHPGYLSSPKSLTSIDWLSDHGALLHTIASHALLSGDRAFAERWTETIVKACQFIKDARALPRKVGYPGILPPAVATDNGTRIQAVWNDGWNYKGLTSAVRLLKQLDHPRAAEFADEARAYREAYAAAFHDKCAKMPTWTDASGASHTLVPTALAGDHPAETRGAFYLDTGPLFLVYSGLIPADDPLMRSTLAWFREGPQTKFARRGSYCWQVPFLNHEMSSCEPCYSWNVFHPHATADRRKYLEGMYSLFAGSVSRETFISCETRGGITGNLFAAPLAVYLARLAVVDDQIEPGTLHLLRLAPMAWLSKERETRFERLPTEYGPVTLRFRLQPDGKGLDVTWEPKFRGPAPRVVLHVPPMRRLGRLTLNGAPTAFDEKVRTIEIPAPR